MDNAEQRLAMLRVAVVTSIGDGTPDLQLLALAVLLQVYATPVPQTVRGLAKLLLVGKSSVTRSVDNLVRLQLVERLDDPADRRSLHLGRTAEGDAFVLNLAKLMVAAV